MMQHQEKASQLYLAENKNLKKKIFFDKLVKICQLGVSCIFLLINHYQFL